MGKDKESQGEFSHSASLFSASRDISYILGKWLYQYWENFNSYARFPCPTMKTTYMKLKIPGMQEECKPNFSWFIGEILAPSGAVYEGEERGMSL
jgi:hypothetical protein